MVTLTFKTEKLEKGACVILPTVMMTKVNNKTELFFSFIKGLLTVTIE